MTREQLIVKIKGQRIQAVIIGVVDERRKDTETRSFTLEAIKLRNGVILEFPPHVMGCYRPVTKVCAAPDCLRIFVPRRMQRRYCSPRCYQRIYHRQLRTEKRLRDGGG